MSVQKLHVLSQVDHLAIEVGSPSCHKIRRDGLQSMKVRALNSGLFIVPVRAPVVCKCAIKEPQVAVLAGRLAFVQLGNLISKEAVLSDKGEALVGLPV